jgi:dipeptidyl aminopeptidase/acylaminoacyl peptidase
VRALDGTATETPLTTDGGDNVQPAWSPDGKFLAYHAYKRGGIWIIPSRGGTPKQIVTQGSKPAWSRDGRRIAYQSDEHADAAPRGYGAQNGSTIWMVDAEGANQTELTHTGVSGRRTRRAGLERRWPLHLLSRCSMPGATTACGCSIAKLAPRRCCTRATTFSKRYLRRTDLDDLRGWRRCAHHTASFRSGDGETQRPAARSFPSPACRASAGCRSLQTVRASRLPASGLNSQIWSQRIPARDGTPAGPPTALTDDRSRRTSLPAISPDGARLAYMSSRQGERANVWMMDVDGSHPVQLTSGSAFESQPEWFPDSVRVAYQSKSLEDDGPAGDRRDDADGRKARRLRRAVTIDQAVRPERHSCAS